MSKQIKLIALDVDGTLLNSKKAVPEANQQAIRQAIARGVKVTLATGRAFPSAMALVRELNIDTAPLICNNGALIKDAEGREWWSRRMDLDIARQIARWADAEGHALITVVEDWSYYTWPESWAGENWKPRAYERVVDNSLSILTAPPLCIMVVGERASHSLLERFASQYQGKVRFDRYVSGDRLALIVVIDASASKEQALAFLCRRWGLHAGQVMAMGDNLLDLGMLRWAGVGVAMGNASPEVRKEARWVAPHNDEAGVAWAIRHFVLGND